MVATDRPETVELKCPKCQRFLAAASGYGRSVCRDCGWEIEVRSPAVRKQEPRYPMGG